MAKELAAVTWGGHEALKLQRPAIKHVRTPNNVGFAGLSVCLVYLCRIQC